MVKKHLFFLFLLLSFLKADMLDDKIASFIGKNKYQESKNLISFLFFPKEGFYKNNDVDAMSVLTTLNANGLLNLYTKEPKEVELIFQVDFNHLISLKVISESLTSMGYSFFLTKNLTKSAEGLKWHVDLTTQHVPNPIIFQEKLNERGCFIEDVKKENDVWSYKINTQYAEIEALNLQKDRQHELKKLLSAYWIKVEDTKKVTIRSHNADFWYPKVSFYDEALNFLNKIEEDDRKLILKVAVPNKAKYIKIEDKYTLENIKRGIKVTLE